MYISHEYEYIYSTSKQLFIYPTRQQGGVVLTVGKQWQSQWSVNVFYRTVY